MGVPGLLRWATYAKGSLPVPPEGSDEPISGPIIIDLPSILFPLIEEYRRLWDAPCAAAAPLQTADMSDWLGQLLPTLFQRCPQVIIVDECNDWDVMGQIGKQSELRARAVDRFVSAQSFRDCLREPHPGLAALDLLHQVLGRSAVSMPITAMRSALLKACRAFDACVVVRCPGEADGLAACLSLACDSAAVVANDSDYLVLESAPLWPSSAFVRDWVQASAQPGPTALITKAELANATLHGSELAAAHGLSMDRWQELMVWLGCDSTKHVKDELHHVAATYCTQLARTRSATTSGLPAHRVVQQWVQWATRGQMRPAQFWLFQLPVDACKAVRTGLDFYQAKSAASAMQPLLHVLNPEAEPQRLLAELSSWLELCAVPLHAAELVAFQHAADLACNPPAFKPSARAVSQWMCPERLVKHRVHSHTPLRPVKLGFSQPALQATSGTALLHALQHCSRTPASLGHSSTLRALLAAMSAGMTWDGLHSVALEACALSSSSCLFPHSMQTLVLHNHWAQGLAALGRLDQTNMLCWGEPGEFSLARYAAQLRQSHRAAAAQPDAQLVRAALRLSAVQLNMLQAELKRPRNGLALPGLPYLCGKPDATSCSEPSQLPEGGPAAARWAPVLELDLLPEERRRLLAVLLSVRAVFIGTPLWYLSALAEVCRALSLQDEHAFRELQPVWHSPGVYFGGPLMLVHAVTAAACALRPRAVISRRAAAVRALHERGMSGWPLLQSVMSMQAAASRVASLAGLAGDSEQLPLDSPLVEEMVRAMQLADDAAAAQDESTGWIPAMRSIAQAALGPYLTAFEEAWRVLWGDYLQSVQALKMALVAGKSAQPAEEWYYAVMYHAITELQLAQHRELALPMNTEPVDAMNLSSVSAERERKVPAMAAPVPEEPAEERADEASSVHSASSSAGPEDTSELADASPGFGALPADEHREEVVDVVSLHDITVVTGKTGSGKSTRVPVFLYEAAAAAGEEVNIIITVPRRIAAQTLARRVAASMPPGRRKLGDLVGYAVGNEPVRSRSTRILFVTTGWFLQWYTHNPQKLCDYTHLLLDEVHERTMDADLSMALLRRELLALLAGDYASGAYMPKLLLMSATLQTEMLQEYFGAASEYDVGQVHVGERAAQLTHVYLDDLDGILNKPRALKREAALRGFSKAEEGLLRAGFNQMQAAALKSTQAAARKQSAVLEVRQHGVNQIRQTISAALLLAAAAVTPGHAVMVFVPGMLFLNEAHDLLQEDKTLAKAYEGTSVVYVHSMLEYHEELLALVRALGSADSASHPGAVILATNIMESAVTVPALTHVIDFGMYKGVVFDTTANADALRMLWSSKASVEQRGGRAGRITAGWNIRLFPSSFYLDCMPAYDPPEMQLVSMTAPVLRAKILRPEEHPVALLMDCLSPPERHAVDSAIGQLYYSGGLPGLDGKSPLTELGIAMASFPGQPSLARMFVAASAWGHELDAAVLSSIQECQAPLKRYSPMFFPDPWRLAEMYLSQVSALSEAEAGSCSMTLAIRQLYLTWRALPHGHDRFCRDHHIQVKHMRSLHQTVKHKLKRWAEAAERRARSARVVGHQSVARTERDASPESCRAALNAPDDLLRLILLFGMCDSLTSCEFKDKVKQAASVPGVQKVHALQGMIMSMSAPGAECELPACITQDMEYASAVAPRHPGSGKKQKQRKPAPSTALLSWPLSTTPASTRPNDLAFAARVADIRRRHPEIAVSLVETAAGKASAALWPTSPPPVVALRMLAVASRGKLKTQVKLPVGASDAGKDVAVKLAPLAAAPKCRLFRFPPADPSPSAWQADLATTLAWRHVDGVGWCGALDLAKHDAQRLSRLLAATWTALAARRLWSMDAMLGQSEAISPAYCAPAGSGLQAKVAGLTADARRLAKQGFCCTKSKRASQKLITDFSAHLPSVAPPSRVGLPGNHELLVLGDGPLEWEAKSKRVLALGGSMFLVRNTMTISSHTMLWPDDTLTGVALLCLAQGFAMSGVWACPTLRAEGRRSLLSLTVQEASGSSLRLLGVDIHALQVINALRVCMSVAAHAHISGAAYALPWMETVLALITALRARAARGPRNGGISSTAATKADPSARVLLCTQQNLDLAAPGLADSLARCAASDAWAVTRTDVLQPWYVLTRADFCASGEAKADCASCSDDDSDSLVGPEATGPRGTGMTFTDMASDSSDTDEEPAYGTRGGSSSASASGVLGCAASAARGTPWPQTSALLPWVLHPELEAVIVAARRRPGPANVAAMKQHVEAMIAELHELPL